MPQAKFIVKSGCSYGKQGDIVLIDVPESGLTSRQQVMLERYEDPEVKDLTAEDPKPEDPKPEEAKAKK